MSAHSSPTEKLRHLKICVLGAILLFALPGIFLLKWDHEAEENSGAYWILYVECHSDGRITEFESVAHLDSFLKNLCGHQSVLSPLSISSKPSELVDPETGRFDLNKAQADTGKLSNLNLVNPDAAAFRIFISPEDDSIAREPFPEELSEAFKSLSWIDRAPPESIWVPRAQREQLIIIPAVIVAFLLALRFALQSWRAALGAITTSAYTVIIVFGTMGWIDIPLNLLILAIPVSILAIGTSEDVHLISYAQRKRSQSRANGESALRTHRIAISCTAFTTAMGFAALLAGGHQEIQKFAIIGSISVALRFTFLRFLFPYICKTLPERELDNRRKFAQWLGDTIWKQNLVLSTRYRFLFICGVVCLVLSLILGILIQPSIVPHPLLRLNSVHMSTFAQHREAFGSQFIAEINISGLDSTLPTQDRLASIELVSRELQDRIPTISILSEVDFWRAAIQELDTESMKPWTEYSDAYLDQVSLLVTIPQMLNQPSKDNAAKVYLIGDDSQFTSESIGVIQTIALENGDQNISLEINPSLQDKIAQYSQFKHTLLYSTIITSTLICLLIGFIYLSSVAAITTLFCNLLPAAGVGIGICALGIPISPVTSLFVSLSLGVAVNDTLYLLSTYHEYIRSIPDRKAAVRQTLQAAAYPILISTITLSLAFLMLSFSEFREIASLGIIITLVLLSAMFCDLWVTPVLFLKVRIIPIWEQLSKEYMGVIHGKAPLFKNMPARHIRKFIYFGRIQKAPPETQIFTEDENGNTCILILSGTCIVSKRSIVGSVFVSRLRTGDIAGELSLEKGSKRSATITTEETVDYIEFDWEQLDSFRHQYPRAASYVFFNLSQIISRRLRGTLHDLAASSHPFTENAK
ncbi:MAG: MMPL family transporter [Opitutales bacterium]